ETRGSSCDSPASSDGNPAARALEIEIAPRTHRAGACRLSGWSSRSRRYGILCCSSSLATYSAVILFPDPGRPSTKIILVPSIVAYTAQPRRIVSHGSYFDKDLWPPGRASYPPGTAQGFSAARGSEAR